MSARPIPQPLEQPRVRKKLVRRTGRDRSQQLRRGVQLAFLALNVWIGTEFYLWVRAIERGGIPPVARPAGIEGWLPIAGLMNLVAWMRGGAVPEIHPAGMFLLIAFLGISILVKKAFCSWLCPVGTISEYLWMAGRKLFGRNFDLPRWADIPLRSLKYLLLAFFGWAIIRMSARDVAWFMTTPYGLIADVKLLNFFRYIGLTGAAVLLLLAVLSLLVRNFWCRYLCPYGALLGLAALLSPTQIRRDADACIDCAKCTKVCPSRLPVDVLPRVRSAECTMCMACTAICPAKGALEVKVTPRRRVPAWAVAAAIAATFVAVVAGARISGHWSSGIPDDVYRELVPRSGEVVH